MVQPSTKTESPVGTFRALARFQLETLGGDMSDSFIMPPVCCVCLGAADTHTTVSCNQYLGTYTQKFSLTVPMCAQCFQRRRRTRRRAAIVAGLAVLVGAILGLTVLYQGDTSIGRLGALAMGLTLGALLAWFLHSLLRGKQPVGFDLDGRPSFENWEYQKRFKSANSDYYRHLAFKDANPFLDL